MVSVKEVKSDRIMLSVVGDTRGFRIEKLPLGLAASIAERILPRDAPLTMVMKGAFFAVREKEATEKQFRDQGCGWWKEAGEADPNLQEVIRELAKQYPQ